MFDNPNHFLFPTDLVTVTLTIILTLSRHQIKWSIFILLLDTQGYQSRHPAGAKLTILLHITLIPDYG